VYVADAECPTLLGLHTIGKDGKGKRRITQPCRIVGTERADALKGTDDTNAIYGLAGHDRIHAGGAADNVQGGQGNDELDGGDGDDRMNGGPGLDTIDGSTGWDAIISRDRAVDRIRCGPGRDAVWADESDIVARDCEEITWRS
jgi:Ca2+-binding RTX toxin-like protein